MISNDSTITIAYTQLLVNILVPGYKLIPKSDNNNNTL